MAKKNKVEELEENLFVSHLQSTAIFNLLMEKGIITSDELLNKMQDLSSEWATKDDFRKD